MLIKELLCHFNVTSPLHDIPVKIYLENNPVIVIRGTSVAEW